MFGYRKLIDNLKNFFKSLTMHITNNMVKLNYSYETQINAFSVLVT